MKQQLYYLDLSTSRFLIKKPMVILLLLMETLELEAFMVIVTPMAIAQHQVGLLTKLVAALSFSEEGAVFLQDKIIMSE